MKGYYGQLAVTAGLMVAAGTAWTNNLVVTNVTVGKRDSTTAIVQFDISWQNSWRYTNVNHDAAWVFFKVLPETRTAWEYVTMEGSGTNPAGYSTGTGTPVELVVPADRVGLFVRRSAEGSGAVSVQNVKVVWNIASHGLSKSDRVRMQALAVEMVFVAEGAFWAGNTNGIINSSFHAQGNDNSPVNITSTNAFTLYWGTGDGNNAVIPNTFPNGYKAFYCMKHELTQGQYTDFLNQLTATQASNRFLSAWTTGRSTLTDNGAGVTPRYSNSTPDRACIYIRWSDGVAFADWAGLRQMTELEFEKACRGPLASVQDEYAWGNTTISQTTAILNDGTGTDTVVQGNCHYSGSPGPCRVGIYATGSSSREAAGASYWGIMELSGNLWERAVTVGNASGLAFSGSHGNGVLDSNGNADIADWITGDDGFRGGPYSAASTYARVSDRPFGALGDANGGANRGFRAVRTAPPGVGP